MKIRANFQRTIIRKEWCDKYAPTLVVTLHVLKEIMSRRSVYIYRGKLQYIGIILIHSLQSSVCTFRRVLPYEPPSHLVSTCKTNTMLLTY